jgi:hypothetical protein
MILIKKQIEICRGINDIVTITETMTETINTVLTPDAISVILREGGEAGTDLTSLTMNAANTKTQE